MSADSFVSEVERAVEFASCHLTYVHFLSGNDTGLTGSHQSGILMTMSSWPIMFEEQPVKDGSPGNPERRVRIEWQGGDREETDSRFIYYRTGTRNEFRLTRFGRGFTRIRPECTGNLFVLCRDGFRGDVWAYRAWTFSSDEDIRTFLDAFGLSPADTNRLISAGAPPVPPDRHPILDSMLAFAESLTDFPDTVSMAASARKICEENLRPGKNNPDSLLLEWMRTEYALFRTIERTFYNEVVEYGFPSIEQFLNCAQTILQRRKARAGKSFEHHLGALFSRSGLNFTAQGVTELNKRPDFVFPSIDAYHDSAFPKEKLVVLAAKTTCKDRWRQVISEAERVDVHYLATLQEGISPAQCREIAESRVRLVVPEKNISTFPPDFRSSLMTVRQFIDMTENLQNG